MNLNRLLVAGAAAAGLTGAISGAYVGLVTGRLTIDLGIGRRTRMLGPLVIDISAPRDMVFAAAAAPYEERQSRAMQEKVHVLERTDRMVLAAHRTPVGKRLVAVTVETVRLDPPERMGFRLLRGPVPLVIETFEFVASPAGTRLIYAGELGTDLWRAGQLWGDLVTRSWLDAVESSLAAIKAEAERRAR